MQMADEVMSRGRYAAPTSIVASTLSELLAKSRRTLPDGQQARFGFAPGAPEPTVWFAGDRTLLERPVVAIVGTRKVSEDGRRRATKLARELASAGVVIASGLAAGVDSIAMSAALQAGGRLVGVIGTGMDRATPTASGPLQERIYRDHLLVSQFQIGSPVYKGNFPARNRLMAALSDATVIVEASETSGTLHQAAECLRLGRPLFIMKSVVDDLSLSWPTKFVSAGAHKLERTAEIMELIPPCT